MFFMLSWILCTSDRFRNVGAQLIIEVCQAPLGEVVHCASGQWR